ncbi:MAG: RnfABCDGE type electron transport complex subunit B [Burkholderiales bacterium]|nr:RnfABCDGE type electron transport complex subunit B [Burkholderiales bacterium]
MKRPRVALIDEARCIGCARCLAACPVDAIVGAEGFMHVVIANYCVGCEKCLPPCPMDCIAMVPAPAGYSWTEADARAAKLRHARRRRRQVEAEARLHTPDAARRRAVLAAVLARARERRR